MHELAREAPSQKNPLASRFAHALVYRAGPANPPVLQATVLGPRMGKFGSLELNQIQGIRIADCREAGEKNLYMVWSPLLGAYNSHNKPMQRHFYRPVYF